MARLLLILSLLPINIFAHNYINPLASPIKISGSFGEYRPRSLHTGIDLRTFNTVGVPIVAVTNGYIEKLHGSNISYGYGRAIYLRHYDKRLSVYGHLDTITNQGNARLAWSLFDTLSETASFSIYLPPDQIPVKTKDFLGTAGDAGSGPFHLHYSLLNKEGLYIDPSSMPTDFYEKKQNSFFNVSDTIPPVLQTLYIYTPDNIMGSSQIQKCNLKKKSENDYYCGKTIPVNGPVCFRLMAYDRANAINRLGLSGLQLQKGTEKLYWVNVQKFSRKESYLVNKYYDPYRSGISWVRYTHFACWPQKNTPANKLPSWVLHAKNNGWFLSEKLNLGQKENFSIIANDAVGNIATVRFTIERQRGKRFIPKKVDYPLKRGKRHIKTQGNLKVTTHKLKSPASLRLKKINRSRKNKNFVYSKTGWDVKWKSSSWQGFRVVIKTGYQKNKNIALNNRWLNAKYDARHKGYTATLYRGGKIFVVYDTKAPRIGLKHTYGPLAHSSFNIWVEDSGSGIEKSSFEFILNGKKLSNAELDQWGVYYDNGRKSFVFPTSLASLSVPFERHHYLARVQDKAGNYSQKIEGMMLLGKEKIH